MARNRGSCCSSNMGSLGTGRVLVSNVLQKARSSGRGGEAESRPTENDQKKTGKATEKREERAFIPCLTEYPSLVRFLRDDSGGSFLAVTCGNGHIALAGLN